jgi:hypothetical protein
MTFVWGWTSIAFTWYVFIGAMTTIICAWTVQLATRRPRPA